jgi:hypothetical protein
LSITPSTVTDNKCTNQLPVIKDNCRDGSKPASIVLPQPQSGTGDIKLNQKPDEPKATPSGCLDAKAC